MRSPISMLARIAWRNLGRNRKRTGLAIAAIPISLIAGALAGLVALNDVMGFRHRFLNGFSPGYGYTGIAVALLARPPDLLVDRRGDFVAYRAGAGDVVITNDIPLAARAVAGGALALTSAEVRERYGLRSGSAVSQAVDALLRRGLLARAGTAVTFEDPFFGAWVRKELPPGV